LNLAALPSFVAVDLLVRFRRLSTLVLLAAMFAVAWMWIPQPGSGHALMVIGNQRALQTSGAIGLGTATLATLFIGLFGFYAVSNSIGRDVRTRCGQILASTPLASSTYLAGRFAGNLAYLAALTAVFAGGSFLMVFLRGEGPLEPLRFLGQYVLLCTPALVAVAGLAIFFEVTPVLRTRAGDLAFFILWIALLGMQASSTERGGTGNPWLDLSGFVWISQQIRLITGSDMLGIGRIAYETALPPVKFDGIPFTVAALGGRMKAAILPLLLFLPSLLLFHRFDPARVKAKGTTAAGGRRGYLLFLGRIVEAIRPPAPRGLFGAALWDARLTLLERPLFVIAIGAVWIAGLAAGPAALPAAVVVAGLLVAGVASREAQASTSALVGQTLLVGSRTGAWKLLTALIVTLAVMAPLIIRTAVSDPAHAARIAGGALLLAGTSNLLGFLTRGPRTFIAILLTLTYVAASSNGAAELDFAGFSASSAPVVAVAWAAAAVAFAGASLVAAKLVRSR
jgi:hypothetical protein